MSASTPSPRKQRGHGRFVPYALLAFIILVLFIGGAAAALYLVFAEYSGVRNVWLLACGAPMAAVGLGTLAVYSLYARYGRPLRQILDALDAVGAGDLAVRVPNDNSPQFGALIRRFNKMVGELESAEKRRRNLTADIAHELRTPLHLIQGNLEGLLDGVYQPTAEHINATLDETRLLGRLVNDLQLLSLAETGQLPLHPTRFLLADLLHDVAASFGAQAAAVGVSLETRLADPALAVVGDYDRLNQVLSNLVANALRFTPAGGAVWVEAEAGPRTEQTVRIRVKDTGAGIEAADLPFVFDRFWRGDRSRQERTHSGLGLAVAQQLLHAHGGSIEVSSEVGVGSTFLLELPLRREAGAAVWAGRDNAY